MMLVFDQGRTQEGLMGLKPPKMLNILGVFSPCVDRPIAFRASRRCSAD